MLFAIVKTLLIAVGCTAAGAGCIRMLQAERYQIPALKKQMTRVGGLFMGLDVVIALVIAVLDWYLPVLLSMAIPQEAYRETLCGWIVLGLFAVGAFVMFVQECRIPMRRSFTLTRRICRLIAVAFLLNLAAVLLLNLLGLTGYFLFAAVDYVVLLAALIMRPVEDKINARFYKAARIKLDARKNLVRIGITGSYGKTQTKQILKSVLSEKYRVLATPPSFSTAMGISRTINEQLKPSHQIFIAEMGAQYKGDIKELVKLVRPQYGVITCVGKAHMDTFGSSENIAQTKFELIQGLPAEGKAFFGADNSYGDRLYGMCKLEKYRAGVEEESGAYMNAHSIVVGVHGTRFELICDDGSHVWMKTRLLGRSSIMNIAVSAALARQLGLSMEEIARGVEKARPLRHRLELISDRYHIIDNSANTAHDAAIEALQILSQFPGRRIVVSLGYREQEERLDVKIGALATQIAESADYVVLVDPEDSGMLSTALEERGFKPASVRCVNSEEAAETIVREIASRGDSVLLEGLYLPLLDEDAE